MPRKKCYHCKEWVTEKEKKSHKCWETTEEALTAELPEEIKEAWIKLREFAPQLGEQRIYASHKSIMFSRKACYFFVRPMQKRLEVCFFVGRTIKHPEIKKSQASSKTKIGHIVHVIHSDQIESPLTDWLKEAYDFSSALSVIARPERPKQSPKSRLK